MPKLSNTDLKFIQSEIERLWLHNCYKAYFANSEDVVITPTNIPACDQSWFPTDLIQDLLDNGYKVRVKARPYKLDGAGAAYIEATISKN